MPEDLEEKLLNFQWYIIRLHEEKNFSLSCIANMDETSVFFDMAGDLTINPTGSKTVHIRSIGNEKNRFTVILTCFADGSKFPPIIIFKGKHQPKTIPPQPLGIQVWFQDNGWIDEINMKKYSRYQLSKNLDNSSKMLIYDSFSAHITPDIKASFKNNNTDLIVIPGGLTSIC